MKNGIRTPNAVRFAHKADGKTVLALCVVTEANGAHLKFLSYVLRALALTSRKTNLQKGVIGEKRISSAAIARDHKYSYNCGLSSLG